MDVRCQRCGKLVAGRTSNYKYKESGLDNLYLEGVTIFECSCGALSPSIFRVPHLHDQVAETLLKKPALFSGREIRFLRKNLYMPANAFAKTIGVGKTTLSKWENGLQQQSEAFDRLIRTTYLITKVSRNRDQINTLKHLERIKLRKSEVQYVITAERTGEEYIVSLKPVFGGQAEWTPLIKADFTDSWTVTTSSFAIGQSQIVYPTLAWGINTETTSIFGTRNWPDSDLDILKTDLKPSFELQESM